MPYKKHIIGILQKLTKLQELDLEVPPDNRMGDYAFPCFKLSKEWKKDPKEIANELAEKIKTDNIIREVKAVGPYLNIFINKVELGSEIIKEIQKDKNKFGSGDKKGKIMVEYSQPNTNKPIHVGHFRNTLIGHSLSLLLLNQGYKVVQVNLINDRGVHICKSMHAYKKYGKNKEPDKKPDHFVGDFYVLYAMHQDDDSEKEIQDMLQKWESGDQETRELWKKMTKWALDGFDETYKRLGIKFDKVYYESEYYDIAKKVVEKGLKDGVFTKDSDENVVAELEKFKIPDKVVLRADGTSIYITQDIYLAQMKFKDYKIDKSVYVVGNEQNLHFRQLFKILELLGNKWADKCYHLSYGMVNLPEGKMKSREGKVVDGDDLMDEIVNLAREEVKKRYKDIDNEEIEKRANMIGLGAIRFYLLRVDPVRDVMYDPKESISFDGETGPYVQYAHARCCAIFRKAGIEAAKIGKVEFSLLKQDVEQELVKLLADFPNVVDEAAENYKPSSLCHYLIRLAQKFNDFYNQCQIVKEKDDLKNARLMLVDSVRIVIKNGLSLLGVEAPERM